MVLAVDAGNYKVAFGLFDGMGPPTRTLALTRESLEAGSLPERLDHALEAMESEAESIHGACVASVVPALTGALASALAGICGQVLVLDWQSAPGITIRYEPPSDLGPDRIANAIALYEMYGGPACAVDLGTATNFDVVTATGDFAGGAIAPGLATSAQSLYERAARLRDPGLKPPDSALGRSSAHCLRSGILLGYGGLIDRLVQLLEAEAGPFSSVVATGGLAELVAPLCRSIHRVHPHLTLEGLNIAYHRWQE
ncbi:MAG: type III pantothenate kinase [Armatimonadota bacterium]